jgi:hypothetical protein
VTGGDAPIQSRSLRKRRFMVLMCPRAVPSLFLLKQQRQTVTTILPTCSLQRTPSQSSVSTLGLCAILAHFQMSEDWMEIQRRLKTPKAYRSTSTESVSKRARRHFIFSLGRRISYFARLDPPGLQIPHPFYRRRIARYLRPICSAQFNRTHRSTSRMYAIREK